MKVIIAGSRNCLDYELLCEAIKESKFEITEVVSGCAAGADTMGIRWAVENKIPVKKFPAEWSKYGKQAGMIRNREMAWYGDALIAIHLSGSRGTADMIRVAKKQGLKRYVKEMKIS